jgi:hypothetical protein
MEGSAMNRLAFCIALFTPAAFLASHAPAQTKAYRTVSNETVEKVLQSLDVKYQKGETKGKDMNTMFFDFVRSDTPCRLYNYGNDLWIEVQVEKKMKLEDINRWNADAKFSRLVLIEQKDKTIVSLESQLDCLGGVTEAGMKQYLNRFDAETKKFAKFIK